MPPIVNNLINGRPVEQQKSWKKINEERKALKKQRKQEKQIKLLEKQKEEQQVEEASKTTGGTETKIKENPSTLSIAVPGSILENAQSAELRTYVAGQIARAACIFRANEVIVFDDIGLATAKQTKRIEDGEEEDENGVTKTVRGSCLQLARILQYLECPQYLRKFFFPLHKDLKYSGLLNPLDTPHHLRQQNSFIYREGIISEKKAKEGFSYVNVGLLNDVLVKKAIEPGIRVTVKLNNAEDTTKKLKGTVVSPDEPRRETGVYWGYQVRIAHTISEIFTKSPYEGGYDVTIGTSDRGKNIQEVEHKSLEYKHILVVFGGLKGLEGALANDEQLNVDDPALLFDHYLNILPRQGSRTIRTEEAILIALAALQEKMKPVNADVEEDLSQYLPRSEDTGGSLIPNQQFTKKKKHKAFAEDKAVDVVQMAEEAKDDDEAAEPPAKLQRSTTNNPFSGGKNGDKSTQNPFNKSKKDSADNSEKKSPNKLINKTKRPFNSANTELPVTSANDDDFEVVSAGTNVTSISSKVLASEDLSRFD